MNLDETPDQLAARSDLALAMQELGHALVGHHVDVATATELAETARKYSAVVRHGQRRDRRREMLTSTSVTAALPLQPSVSVAVTVKGNDPTTTGVPESTPDTGSRLIPDGRAPEVTAQVATPEAPDTENGTGPYATPAVAAASEAGPTTSVLQTRIR